jgi:hypothetical protein
MNKLNKKYFIHLGAHRTGSSSFQLSLHENREVLLSSGYGVAFPSRDGVKSGALALRLPRPRHNHDDVLEMSERMASHLEKTAVTGPCGSVLLSEENILGSMGHLERGQFYPAAEKRFRAIYAAIGHAPEHVLLVIREYDSFFRSCFRKRSEMRKVKSFRELMPYYLSMDRGWYEVVQAILENLKPTALTVIDYRHRSTNAALMQKLVPDLGSVPLREPGRALNMNATDAALVAFQKRYGEGHTLSREQRGEIVSAHAGQSESLGVSEYTATEAAALKLRYKRDADRISTIPGITFIG